MDTLKILEQKIVSLVGVVKELKDKNERLLSEKAQLEADNQELKTENAKLAEDNAQLVTKLDVVEGSILKESDQVNAFNEERELAKMMVDDLIKSIDSLVDHENQQ